MIIDCFPFFNELDLLEIRLEELKGVVDWFVMVEARETFSGKPKPFTYDIHRERFADYNICTVKIQSFPPELRSPSEREAYTRNMLELGLNQLAAAPDDVVLLSDLDEIPRASQVRAHAAAVAAGQLPCCVFEMPFSYYFVNYRSGQTETLTRMCRRRDITTMQELRYRDAAIIPNGGWHFGYLGGAEQVREKISAFSHTEFDLPQFTEQAHIEACIKSGADVFGRDYHFSAVPIDLTFPQHLIKHAQRFGHLIFSSSDCPRTATLYAQALLQVGEPVEPLRLLALLSSTVRHITEAGADMGPGTSALLFGRPPKMVRYSGTSTNSASEFVAAANEAGVELIVHNRRLPVSEMEQTDLLHVDANYCNISTVARLRRLAARVNRYLVIHQTEPFGKRGVHAVVAEFVSAEPEWRLLHHFPQHDGLTIFTRH